MEITLKYQDLLLLILISYYEYPKLVCKLFKIEHNPYSPLLILFDNIDHIDIEHHNSSFPSEIEHTYSNLKLYYEDSSYNNLAQIHFIFSLRDANCTLINRQQGDIYHRSKIFYRPLENINKIVERRINIAIKDNIPFTDDQKFLIDFILNDEYSIKVFQPLFNYNYRKFVLFLSEVVQDYNSKHISGIESLSKHKETINGSRGIIFFLVIKYLLSNDYLKKRLFLDEGPKIGGDDGGNVNPARILLTNIHNLSQFSFNKFSKNPHVNPVGLYDLNKEFSEIFKSSDDLFFKILSDLFLFHRDDWCHLITFTDKQVFSNNNFHEEKQLLINAKATESKDAINRLNDIKLHINPSGFIYLRDIIKHYEFFSRRADNNKPLFSSLEYKIINDKIEFNFLKNIDSTFELTEKCILSLNKFIDAKIITNFENTNHCFRTYHLEDDYKEEFYEDQPGRLYLVRIIDTHIQYIDTFKEYLLEYCIKYDKLYENPDNLIFNRDLRVKINKEITLRLEKYVNLLRKSRGVRVANLLKLFDANLIYIKSNYNVFVSINRDRQ